MAICGDNCDSCPRYIATESGESIELEKVKALWVRLGLRGDEFPVEKMVCHGCKPNNACAYAELRSCVQKKSVDNCGCCDDYPCR